MAYERVVFIELPGEDSPVPAGLFTLDPDTGVGRFSYGRRYLLRPNAIALDPVNLPLSDKEFLTGKHNGIFGVIGDMLPDSWGKYILSKSLSIPFGSLPAHEMLDHATTGVVGALSLGLSPDAPTTRTAQPVDLADLRMVMTAFRRALADDDLPPEILYVLEQGTSLGGAQPKCPVLVDGEEWIAKFENSRTPVAFPRLEYMAMSMAAAAGMRVPAIRLVEVEGEAVYLVKRFDRRQGSRLPFVSAHALLDLDLDELEKGTYPGIARAMRIFVRRPAENLRELYRRLVFNVGIRNIDDHLRNHGFLFDDGGWGLSPLYDVLPIPGPKSAVPFSLSLGIGTAGSAATTANLLSCHAHFGLHHHEAVAIIDEIRAVILDWENRLRACGGTDREVAAVRWCFGALEPE